MKRRRAAYFDDDDEEEDAEAELPSKLAKNQRKSKQQQQQSDGASKNPAAATQEPSAAAAAAASNLSDLSLPPVLPFKRRQLEEKYPRGGGARGRHWKHLKQILQVEREERAAAAAAAAAEAAAAAAAEAAEAAVGTAPQPVDILPSYESLDAPPSKYPPKRYCDITGYEAPYVDPHTRLRYANAAVLARIRCLTHDQVQALLALRNAQTVLR